MPLRSSWMASRWAGSTVWVSLAAALELFLPQLLLPVAFVNGQLERGMLLGVGRDAPVLGVAAVTDDDVLDPQVEQAVKGRRAKEDGPGEHLVVPPVGQRAGEEGAQQDGHAQAVREVLLAVQIGVAADRTVAQARLGADGKGDDVIAPGAVPGGRPGDPDAAGGFAGGAEEAEFHAMGRLHNVSPAGRSSCPVSSPRKQKITTTYRMPVADWVERMRAVCQAIQHSTAGAARPTSQRTGSHNTASPLRLTSEWPAVHC